MSWLTDPHQEWSGEASETARPQPTAAEAPFFGPGAYRTDAADYAAAGEPYPGQPRQRRPNPPQGRLKWIVLGIAGWLAVSLIVLCSLLLARGPHSATVAKSAPSRAAAPASSSSSNAAVPDGWVQKASDDQTNCAAHAYGKVAAFFATTPCKAVHRTLMLTNQSGRDVVVAAYTITFGAASDAARFNGLVTADGTGNVNDLLREGVRFSGGPNKLPASGFASKQDGASVRVAEAGYVKGKSSGSDATLAAVAAQAISPA